jgi:hypothetical protein
VHTKSSAFKALIADAVAANPRVHIHITGATQYPLGGIAVEVGEDLLSIQVVCMNSPVSMLPPDLLDDAKPKMWLATFYVSYDSIRSLTFDMPLPDYERAMLFGEVPAKAAASGLTPEALRELGLE